MGILATYKAYKEYEPQYNDWQQRRNLENSKKEILANNGAKPINNDPLIMQKKARTVAQSMLVLDNYAQSKAEDVETVFQTLQMELLAGLSAVVAVPTLLTSVNHRLNKMPNKSGMAQSMANLLDKYSKSNFKLGKLDIPGTKILTGIVAAASVSAYVPLLKDAVINQVGATRRAKFEGMNKELSNLNDFAILTDEQENKVQEIKSAMPSKNNSKFKESKVAEGISEFLDNINISESMKSVKLLMKDKKTYHETKAKYDKSLTENEKYFDNALCPEEILTAEENKELFENIIKKVDVASQEPLERIEKIVNVGYSSLFAGGYLEYLLSDKVVDTLKIKNPIIKTAISIGLPIVSYMVLNKNLANLQNSAIKAVRFKNLKEMIDNPDNFKVYSQDQINSIPDGVVVHDKPKKENIFKFVKNIFKDISDYKTYKRTQFPDTKKYLEAKRQIQLSPQQLDEAKELQRNAFMTINKVDDYNQKYSESIETISEMALAPVEIAAPILGDFVGKKISSNVSNPKLKALSRILGVAVGFIPGALSEIYLTSMQRKALRISGMLASEELNNYKKFVNYDNKSFKQLVESSFAFNSKRDMPNPFIAFQSQSKTN